jgi:hypothetical protein
LDGGHPVFDDTALRRDADPVLRALDGQHRSEIAAIRSRVELLRGLRSRTYHLIAQFRAIWHCSYLPYINTIALVLPRWMTDTVSPRFSTLDETGIAEA